MRVSAGDAGAEPSVGQGRCAHGELLPLVEQRARECSREGRLSATERESGSQRRCFSQDSASLRNQYLYSSPGVHLWLLQWGKLNGPLNRASVKCATGERQQPCPGLICHVRVLMCALCAVPSCAAQCEVPNDAGFVTDGYMHDATGNFRSYFNLIKVEFFKD